MLSFARCSSTHDAGPELASSLQQANEAARRANIHHVTVFNGTCPQSAKALEALHPKAVERAYSVMNRYPNVPYIDEIEEAHFLIDRSGYIRARYKHFASEENNVVQLTTQAAILAQEPIVEINLHSH